MYEIHDPDIRGFLLRVRPSGVMTYYLSYRNGLGKRNRYKIGNTGSLTATQARDEASRLAGKVAHGQDIQAERKQIRHEAERAKVSTWRDYLSERYEPWVCAHRKTGDATVKRLKSCFDWLSDIHLAEISHRLIEDWRLQQLAAGKQATSINRDVITLKAAISRAVEWEVIEIHPLRKLKPLAADNCERLRYLSPNEETRLRQALDKREHTLKQRRASGNSWRRRRGYRERQELWRQQFADYLKPMVLISINTGLRRGELFALTWERIDLEKAFITVHWSTSKNSKSRHVPLNAEALSVLSSWKKQSEDSGLVFPGRNGSELTHVKRSWATALKDADIQNFRWHDMRHHFASRLVMADVSLNVVRELLGHADIAMTLRYAHLSPGHKAEAVARLVGA